MKPVVSSFHNRFTQKNYFSFYPHYQVKNAVFDFVSIVSSFHFRFTKKNLLTMPPSGVGGSKKKK